MSDGLVEALKAAGVASEAALEAQVTAELSLVDHEPEQVWKSEGIIAAIAADRDAVLRVLADARLRTMNSSDLDAMHYAVGALFTAHVQGATGQRERCLNAALSLLAPEGPNG